MIIRRELIEWLKKPGAELVVKWIGREMIDAFIIWPGMPIQLHPDDPDPDEGKLSLTEARALIRQREVGPRFSHRMRIYDRSIGQRSIEREHFTLAAREGK